MSATALKYCFYMYHLWANNTRSLMLFFKLYRLHQNKMFIKEKQLAKSIGRMFLLRTVLLLRTQWFSFIQTEVCSFWDLYSTLVMEQISFPECRTHFNFTTSFFLTFILLYFFENFVHECCIYISPCTPPQLLPVPDTPQLYALFCSQTFLWATSS